MENTRESRVKIIEKLKDDFMYYGDYGKQFLSNSDIQNLIYTPTEFKKPIHPTKEMVMGAYFHTAMLEPKKLSGYPVIDASSRSTKVYKEACEEGEILLLNKEKELVEKWVEKMKSNVYMAETIYATENTFEEPAVASIMGNLWKGKADVVTDNYIIDLKTTNKISDFKWKCDTFNYDSQAYIYQRLFGKEMLFFVIDKSTMQLKICDCSPQFIELGKEKVERATEEYNKFYSENKTENVDSYIMQETL